MADRDSDVPDPTTKTIERDSPDVLSISLTVVIVILVLLLLMLILRRYRDRLRCVRKANIVERRGTTYQGIRMRSLIPSVFVISEDDANQKRNARLSRVNGIHDYYSHLSIARELSVEDMPDIDLSRSDSFAVSFGRPRQEVC